MTPDTYLARFTVDFPDSRPLAPVPFLTSAFTFADADAFDTAAGTPRVPDFYTRYGNPTVRAFEDAIARIENAEAALSAPSGMAAFANLLATVVKPGGRVVAQEALYAGSNALLQELSASGAITCDRFDGTSRQSLETALASPADLLVLETPANPMLEIVDLKHAAAVARSAGALSVVDNTIATPLNQRPLDFGCDLVLHSATKALSGHGDCTAGVVAGSWALIERLWRRAHMAGVFLDPFSAWLAIRGMKTLGLRVARQNATALELARRLEARRSVLSVRYPGLPSDPGHEIALRQMDGFGGVISFDTDGTAAKAECVLARLEGIRRSASFGGTTTLAVHPGAMWAGLSRSPHSSPPAPGLVRLGVGLEDVETLWSDLDRALS
ncbi:trans-sulfuration enzyme family protein [Brevundimonas diminuta]|uniref:Methionine gamma-lyase n=1 Tax=Brevundimonas diminuta TaxID=293 RepID=A0A1Z3LVQ7_BREDI|nr:PLP-dependent transferase [Brevundimonas diminuta]ASD26229.1 methionine gamma-lyase [Brevundimonas diminuta]